MEKNEKRLESLMSEHFEITIQSKAGNKNEVIARNLFEISETKDNEHAIEQHFIWSCTDSSGKIEAVLRCFYVNAECIATLEVAVHGPILLKQIKFPSVKLDGVNTYDNLLMPSAWGDNIPRPTKTIKEYKKSFDQDYILYKKNEIIYTYPSILAMQYMTLYNDSGSFYLASYSQSDETFTFNAKVLGSESLELSINHYPFVENGKWTTPECGAAFVEGDWHSAADLYASHMRERFVSPDKPKWMSESFHGWVEIMMKLENQPANWKYRDLPEIYKQISETGINVIHIAGWSGHGHDTLYPDFSYNPELGSAEDLMEALDKITDMGGCAILYTNGRIVDIQSDFYLTGGKEAVCKNEDGKPYTENYGTSSSFAIACPGCDEYTSYMAKQIKKIITEYHARAVQVDQISCNYDPFCFSKNHAHSKPSNNFIAGVEKELTEMRKIHKELNQDFFMWCEGCNERFGQFYDVEQGHGEAFTWQIGESTPEQFLYTYPERTVTGHSYNIEQLYYSYTQGKPFDIKWNCFAQEGAKQWIKDFVGIRRKLPEYFFEGIFRDNVDFEISPGTKACGILRKDRKAILINVWKRGADKKQNNKCWIKTSYEQYNVKNIYPENLKTNQDCKWVMLEWTGPVASIEITKKEN